MPYDIENPQIDRGYGIAEKNSVTDSLTTGTIQPGAIYVSFLNMDGSGGATATVGVQGQEKPLPPGVAKNYGGILGSSGQIRQTLSWTSNGANLAIVALY